MASEIWSQRSLARLKLADKKDRYGNCVADQARRQNADVSTAVIKVNKIKSGSLILSSSRLPAGCENK